MKKWLLIIPAALIVIYLVGPSPETPVYNKTLPAVPSVATELEHFIAQKEALHAVKPDNESKIIWANDSLKQKTQYCLVYLHGFSASSGEGAPVNINTARKFGWNLYMPRLAEHGLDTLDAMKTLTAEKYWESAKEALAVGKQLGEKIILMGTSTGGTLALMLGAAYPSDVYAQVLLSPNIAINDPAAWVLNNHWGLQMARMVNGSDYMTSDDTRPLVQKYWYSTYRLEGAVALQELLETSMTRETFQKVKQPLLLLYYYKDEANQDKTVKVSAMLDMYAQLGTPADKKMEKAMPLTGNHVIGSPIKSKDVAGVEREVTAFLEKIR